MEWKKILIQAAISAVIGAAGVLIAFGVMQGRIEAHSVILQQITDHTLPAIENQIDQCVATQASLVEADNSNQAAHAAILRELDSIQRQLQVIQNNQHKHAQ